MAAMPVTGCDRVVIVGSGRCGSTLLSTMLGLHPAVAVASELTVNLFPFEISPGAHLTGPDFAALLLRPRAEASFLLRHALEPPEFLYPVDAGARFDRQTGVPPLALVTIPALFPDPDEALNEVVGRLSRQLPASAAHHFDRLLGILGELTGCPTVIERSGGSLGYAQTLSALLPDARLVHLHRDGRDCALSMARHSAFRLAYFHIAIAEQRGLSPDACILVAADEIDDAVTRVLGAGWSSADFMDHPLPIAWFGRYWSLVMTAGLAQLRTCRQPLMHISYQDLVDRPEDTLGRLGQHLGLQPGPDWLTDAGDTVDPTRGGAWRDLSEGDRRRLESACRLGERALAASRREASTHV